MWASGNERKASVLLLLFVTAFVRINSQKLHCIIYVCIYSIEIKSVRSFRTDVIISCMFKFYLKLYIKLDFQMNLVVLGALKDMFIKHDVFN